MQPDLSEVYSAVMKLPDKYKTAIHLYYYEEYSVKEISAIEGCTESAVKSQLSRARQMLKTILEEEDSYV
jgi:RNA polymerase sigma factor (sigma-70 family)